MHRDTKAKKITIQPSNNKSRTINIKKNAQIVEWITNKNQLNKKIITKIKIAANTKVDYIFLLDKKFNSDFIENRIIEVEDNVKINSWYCYLGGEKNQINLNYKIKSNAKIKHKTIFLAKGNQEFVFNDNYEFLSPNSTGKFNIYGILKNNAKSNNLANIIVNEKANKIKSRINIKLHLLGNKTQGLMLPRLDINNDDVQAGHSASLANISQDELFYMQTRGISKTMAEKLMIDEIFSNFNKELFSEKIAKHIKL